MHTILADVRHSLRRLRHQPGFTVVAVFTLALGIGANTAIFTLIHGVMLRPLPVERPHELHRLGETLNCCVNSGLQTNYSLYSLDLFQHLEAQLDEFSDLAAFQANTTATGVRAEGASSAVSIPTSFVSGNYFQMLGVRPAHGRLLQPADDQPGAPVVMTSSYRAWMEQFGGDPSVINKTFSVGGSPVTLVGVAAPEFFGETVRANPAGIWLPLGQEPVLRGATASLSSRPQTDWLYAIGRLKPGRSPDDTTPRATHALQRWLSAQTFLGERDRERIGDQRIVVTSAATGVQAMANAFGQSLTLLFAMSALVLFIAAANLANLLLARADRVQASVRAALGASTRALVRQSLTDGLLLALAGCGGAWIVSTVAASAIIALAFPAGTLLPMDATPTAPVLLFSLALGVGTALLFSAGPAWSSARADPIDALRGSTREGADRAFVPRRTLVVVQITLSMVLLAAAGLLSKSLGNLRNQPLGFVPDQQIVARIDPPALADEPDELAAIYDRMRHNLLAVPGITRVSHALYGPMEGNNWSSGVAIDGRASAEGEQASWNRVGPDYFETTGTRVLRGRGITTGDTPSSRRVTVVNQAFADRFFPGRDALGGRLGLGGPAHSSDYEIVGIVEDVKYRRASRAVLPMFFLPALQTVEHDAADMRQVQARSTLMRAVLLRVDGRAGAWSRLEPDIRRALSASHPDLTVLRVMPMSQQIADGLTTERLLAVLAGSYGVLALLLAALGLYGVTAYGVKRRTHEIGIRMALGADTGRIVWTILRGALVQAAIGLAIGIPLALAAADAVASQLYEVSARDPFVLGAAAFVLLVTAVAAAVLPARRAANVSPTRALRAQ